ITLIGANPQELTLGEPYIELGATASDDVDGDISGNIATDASAVDVLSVGSYEVTYNVSDLAGNQAVEAVRTVNVSASTGASLVKVFNSDTDEFLFYLVDGMEITKDDYTGIPFAVTYQADAAAAPVQFALSGPIAKSQREGVAPFSLFGDMSGDLAGNVLPLGSYQLSIAPSNQPGLILNFKMVT
ncbi:DUF5011 domain-containing protein, partial [Confluentibacter lentus]|uniref:DUF5011 domain-containing protein n=1 Tax=Confluentibacter lentus TaxID=1699412 RepID=UPI0012FE3B73